MKITLGERGDSGELTEEIFESSFEGIGYIMDWLRTKNFQESVFVCFGNWGGLPPEKLRDEQDSILVSHNFSDIKDMVFNYLNVHDHEYLVFVILEYPNYVDAFGYCIDLKEGF